MHIPAEWEPHDAVWMAWPYRDDEWPNLEEAQHELRALINAIAQTERVDLLVPPDAELPAFATNVRLITDQPYGDSWTRDTGPIMGKDADGRVGLCFRFNGWGGKYLMKGDEDLAARLSPTRSVQHDFVLEGGALELDGAGAVMTTRDVLLNENRQPPADIEAKLKEVLQVERVIWLEGQLRNDHTDGHIDMVARFVRPGEVVCMHPEDDDPNREVLEGFQTQLQAEGLRVHRVPSPGRLEGDDGALLPASYLNYYLANDQVLVPIYGLTNDERALQALAGLFPNRQVQGLSARFVLEGGGAFHCVTQQQPA